MGGRKCFVPACSAKSGKMFRFPADEAIREQWKQLCSITKPVTNCSWICLRHFKESDYYTFPMAGVRMRDGAVPSLNLQPNFPTSEPDVNKKERRCAVKTCRKRVRDGVTLHLFPKFEERRKQWQTLCGLKKLPSIRTYICSLHFCDADFSVHGDRKMLKPTATPSLCLNNDSAMLPEDNAVPQKGDGSHGAVECAETVEMDVVCSTGQDGFGSHKSSVTNSEESPICSADAVRSSSSSDSLFSNDAEKLAPVLGEVSGSSIAGLSDRSSSNLTEGAMSICDRPLTDHFENVSLDNSVHVNSFDQSKEEEGLNFSELSDAVISGVDVTDKEEVTSLFESSLYQKLSTRIKDDINDIVDSSPSSNNGSFISQPTLESEVFADFLPFRPQANKKSNVSPDSASISLVDLVKSDVQLRAFAGVGFKTLNCLVDLMTELAGKSDKCLHSMRKRALLVLCKLRLNLSFECLGSLFNVDRHLCGHYFSSTLHLMAQVLKHVIYWPSKEEIKLNMPKCFKKFQDTRVILDCTEIPVDTPQCMKCQILLYSHYKKCQTIKVMVGVAPSGLITYVSPVYGGRASDKLIFEESDIIAKNLLDPFVDAVMVDKGFRIDAVCEEKQIKIHRPPFIIKKQPLNNANANRNIDIAHARVHVERVIQRMKIFKILQCKISRSLMPQIDEVMTVIAALVNLGPPIFSDDRFMYYDKV